ncbi:hypothetical protein KIN20_027514 [Parelaphostrongylus tenuis]|uniref:Aldehyde dehydrogenase domain-containing protein n=1 Tax=Parelaphostrongylus tenuis TaxID=148309 RepID=A0AAD5WE67_PARTN|nr:hypothetical protein KIN20_027514 [Parelaphostrongylus tenuis]
MNYSELVSRQRQYFRGGEPTKIEHREKQLQNLRRLITDNSDTLCDAVYQDLRKHPQTTYAAEIFVALVEIDYMLDNLKKWSKPTMVQKTFATALDQPMIVRETLGVVLIISPWNYPIFLSLLPIIPAIAAGNTVVIKPSEMSPHTAEAFEKLFAKYFAPEFLTVGCPPIGKIVMAAAAKHLTPVTLELGGKCPVVVEDDAVIDITARRIAWGKWTNCGQTCIAPDYVLVSESTKPKLVEALRRCIGEFYGNDIKSSKDYSRIINKKHHDRICSLLDSSHGTILFQGGEVDRDDLFIPPVIIDAKKDDPFMKDEIFGPVLPVLTIRDLDEAIDYINSG